MSIFLGIREAKEATKSPDHALRNIRVFSAAASLLWVPCFFYFNWMAVLFLALLQFVCLSICTGYAFGLGIVYQYTKEQDAELESFLNEFYDDTEH